MCERVQENISHMMQSGVCVGNPLRRQLLAQFTNRLTPFL